MEIPSFLPAWFSIGMTNKSLGWKDWNNWIKLCIWGKSFRCPSIPRPRCGPNLCIYTQSVLWNIMLKADERREASGSDLFLNLNQKQTATTTIIIMQATSTEADQKDCCLHPIKCSKKSRTKISLHSLWKSTYKLLCLCCRYLFLVFCNIKTHLTVLWRNTARAASTATGITKNK